MPVIGEENEMCMPEADFPQLLDVAETSFVGSNDVLSGAESGQAHPCPSHPNDDCLCHGFFVPADWDTVPAAVNSVQGGLEEPDYSKFENWIPRYIRPEKPCDYCKSKRLQCYLQRGEDNCTPCRSLFRECSLSNSNTLEGNNYFDNSTGVFLDTLHAVDEDTVREQGTFTGIKPLRSKDGWATGPGTPVRLDDAPGSSKRNGIRFPRHAVKILRDWLDVHADHPYPTEEEKADLERETELKPSQIANWLANARRRRKVIEKARPKACMSPSLQPSTPAIAIPAAAGKPWDELNPFERWKNSPPENEPASITDIAHAVAHSDLPEDGTSRSSSSARRKRSSNGSGFSSFRAPSTGSLETTNDSSISSSSAQFSHGSSRSHGSFGSFSSSLAGKKDRRRRGQPAPVSRKPSDVKQRIFQCTFCTDTFKSKYDWTRHEKSLHLSLEKWICAPLGPVVVDSAGQEKCVWCDVQSPSKGHIESHNYRQCEEKGHDARTFYRKDHLRQHLRLMHGCEMTSLMDSWKFVVVHINSRCGFCAQRFTVWQERIDHLTAHFKAGARMVDWKGCRGLDPAIAAQVTNAMPPYLIGIESVSPNPFSATNRSSWRHNMENDFSGSKLSVYAKEMAQKGIVVTDEDLRRQERQLWFGNQDTWDWTAADNPEWLACFKKAHALDFTPYEFESDGSGSRATCWEVLTVRLGKFANEMARKGVVLTDEDLQRHARLILYGDDDNWNQTAADNPEWLDLFKKAHGLDFIPNSVGGQGSQVPEDLETYGDLGLRIPFAVQLQAYNQSQTGKQTANSSNVPGPYLEALEQRRSEFKKFAKYLLENGALYSENYDCGHAGCKHNMVDISRLDGGDATVPSQRRWCSLALPQDLLQQLAAHNGPEASNSSAPYQKSTSPGSDGSRAANLSRGLRILVDLDNRTPDGDDCVTSRDARTETNARMAGSDAMNALPRAEELSAMSTARSSSTQALDTPPGKKDYLQRHRYALPPDRARRFATTTGAWEDSGKMPPAFETAHQMTVCELNQSTTTGALMEFLGGDVGQSLPFSNDTTTSTIAMPSVTTAGADVDWTFATDPGAMQELDQLIASTSALEQLPATSTVAPPVYDMAWTPNQNFDLPDFADLEMPADMAMGDFNFDDMTFDGTFDLPLEEAI